MPVNQRGEHLYSILTNLLLLPSSQVLLNTLVYMVYCLPAIYLFCGFILFFNKIPCYFAVAF